MYWFPYDNPKSLECIGVLSFLKKETVLNFFRFFRSVRSQIRVENFNFCPAGVVTGAQKRVGFKRDFSNYL